MAGQAGRQTVYWRSLFNQGDLGLVATLALSLSAGPSAATGCRRRLAPMSASLCAVGQWVSGFIGVTFKPRYSIGGSLAL